MIEKFANQSPGFKPEKQNVATKKNNLKKKEPLQVKIDFAFARKEKSIIVQIM